MWVQSTAGQIKIDTVHKNGLVLMHANLYKYQGFFSETTPYAMLL